MKIAKILEKVEYINHNQRWNYMIGLGRDSIIDKALAENLLELASSAVHYERILASMSIHGSFDKKIIAILLEDPSAIGMGSVIKLATKHLYSKQLIDIIPRLSKKRRYKIIMSLQAVKRMDVIEGVYVKLSISEQQDVLHFTSEAFLQEHLTPDKIEGFSRQQWRRIAKRFPSITFEQIVEILKKASAPSWQIQQAVYEILFQFHKTAPLMGLSLLKQAITCVPFKGLLLERYSLLFPKDVTELILKHPVHLSVSLPVTMLRKLETETLCELVEKNILANFKIVFPKLKSEQRTALYQSVGESLRTLNGALPLYYVKAIPKVIREKEALHGFHLRILEAKPFERLPYLAVLPFYQALDLAAPFLSQPEGELRAVAVSVVVESGRYDASLLDAILDFCLKREKEQDPVRLAMMNALAELPPTHWLAVHLPKLKSIIAAALRARDCSFGTMAEASRMLFKMLTYQADFVVAEIPLLAERMGNLNVSLRESHISNENMVKLDSCLLPLIKTWIARDRYDSAVSLILSFGRNVKTVYKFQKIQGKQLNLIKILIDLTQDKRGYVAMAGLDTLIKLDIREEVTQLIPQLIKQDSSWVQVKSVSEYLNRHRQDLLTPFLKPCIYRNRFGSGNTAMLIAVEYGFFRWTAKQQQIYADSLNDIVTDEKRYVWELYKCVNRLSAMPSAELTPLINLAKVDAKDAALRDKAIEALGRVDAGRGVTALLQALDDNRANVAIYALRCLILEMSEKDALALLSKAPRNKITVLKEIIRLVGEFDGEASYDFLSSFTKDENLHPDLQIALLRALWKYLNHEEVWQYFSKVAQSDHFAIARSTIRIPQDGLTSNGRSHLCQHIILLLKNKNAQIRSETLERLVCMPLGQTSDTMFDVLSDMLSDIDVNIGALAAKAMLAAYLTVDTGKLIDAFAKIKRPKSMAAVVDAFCDLCFVYVSKLQSCGESLAFAVIKQKRIPSQALKLALMLLPPSNILTILETIDDALLLHPGVVELNLKNWNKAVNTYSKQDIDVLEARLRVSQSVGLRRLGLGLLIELSGRYGWTEEYCGFLNKYCDDVDLWISEAAGLLVPVCACTDLSFLSN